MPSILLSVLLWLFGLLFGSQDILFVLLPFYFVFMDREDEHSTYDDEA
jgi:hypothetical protein